MVKITTTQAKLELNSIIKDYNSKDLLIIFLGKLEVSSLDKLLKNGFVLPENIFLIGFRGNSHVEINYLRDRKIKYFDMQKIYSLGIKNILDGMTEYMRKYLTTKIILDLNVLDPAFAPGTFDRVPCGLTSFELMYFLRRLKLAGNTESIEICGFDEKKDNNGITELIVDTIIKDLST